MPPKSPTLIRTRKERFVLEYLKDLKGEKAAIRAGFPPAGARTQASRMLRDVEVREMLAMHEARLAAKYDLAQDKVIRDIIDLGERAELGGQFATALWAKELAGRHVHAAGAARGSAAGPAQGQGQGQGARDEPGAGCR